MSDKLAYIFPGYLYIDNLLLYIVLLQYYLNKNLLLILWYCRIQVKFEIYYLTIFQCLILLYEKIESPVALGCAGVNVSRAVLLQSELHIAAGLKGQELGDGGYWENRSFTFLVCHYHCKTGWRRTVREFHKVQHFFSSLCENCNPFPLLVSFAEEVSAVESSLSYFSRHYFLPCRS